MSGALTDTSILAGSAGVVSGYTIDQSLRFNPGDNPYLSGTYSGADATAATWSWWYKNTGVGTEQYFCFFCGHAYLAVGYSYIAMHSSGSFDQFFNPGSGIQLGEKRTAAYYRDPNAWYHLMVAIDTTLSTAADRI